MLKNHDFRCDFGDTFWGSKFCESDLSFIYSSTFLWFAVHTELTKHQHEFVLKEKGGEAWIP